ncbi:MAG: hypothetical protein LBG44_02780 [Gemmatimonadota bacterium]|nr:hypothetical protein [Gemmatimonadota bacterium]
MRILASALAFVLALAVTHPAGAQESARGTASSAPAPAELERMFVELQRIHIELEEIQNRALQDSTLRVTQENLGSDIQKAMEAADPSLPRLMARVSVLEDEAQAAARADDKVRLELLVTERDSLTERFFTLQNQIVSGPEMASRVAGFQFDLQQKMLEIAPDAPELISRMRELEMVLRASIEL